MQIKYTHHILFKDTDIAVQTYLKAVFRSRKFVAHVTMWLKLKNIVLSEKSQTQIRFKKYHLSKSSTHSTTTIMQV